MRFMGLDLGGSEARAAAFASNGSLLAGAKGRSAPDEGLPLLPRPASSRTCKARPAPSNPGAESQQTLARDLHP